MEPDTPIREKFRQRLSAERAEQPEQPQALADPEGIPADPAESADEQEDGTQGLLASDETPDTEVETEADLEDETPAEDDTEDEGNTVDWEQRYKDTQAELTRVNQGRQEFEEGLANEEAETLRVRFELQDQLDEVSQRAEFLLQTMSGNANRYRQINWSTVPPEKIQAVQQEAQQAFMLEQQAQQAYQQTQEQAKQARDQLRQREAQIAVMRLKRTIPEWGDERYGQLRDYAASKGLDARAFNDITSAPLIEMINESFLMNTAKKPVTRTAKRRTRKTPASRNAKQVPRDARGKFAKAQQDFRANPGQKGAFANMKLAQLQLERGGR